MHRGGGQLPRVDRLNRPTGPGASAGQSKAAASSLRSSSPVATFGGGCPRHHGRDDCRRATCKGFLSRAECIKEGRRGRVANVALPQLHRNCTGPADARPTSTEIGDRGRTDLGDRDDNFHLPRN
jgi:hypothetical protein